MTDTDAKAVESEDTKRCSACGRRPEQHKHSIKKVHRWERITCKGRDTKWVPEDKH